MRKQYSNRQWITSLADTSILEAWDAALKCQSTLAIWGDGGALSMISTRRASSSTTTVGGLMTKATGSCQSVNGSSWEQSHSCGGSVYRSSDWIVASAAACAAAR